MRADGGYSDAGPSNIGEAGDAGGGIDAGVVPDAGGVADAGASSDGGAGGITRWVRTDLVDVALAGDARGLLSVGSFDEGTFHRLDQEGNTLCREPTPLHVTGLSMRRGDGEVLAEGAAFASGAGPLDWMPAECGGWTPLEVPNGIARVGASATNDRGDIAYVYWPPNPPPNGPLTWALAYQGADGARWQVESSDSLPIMMGPLAVDPSGNVVLVATAAHPFIWNGASYGSTQGGTTLLLKFDAGGGPIWAIELPVLGGGIGWVGTSRLGTVVALADGMPGFTWGEDILTEGGAFLLVAEADGTARFGRTLPEGVIGPLAAIDPDGATVAIATRGQTQMNVYLYDLAGNLLWHRWFNGLFDFGSLTFAGHDVALAGRFWNTVDLGKGPMRADPVSGFLLELSR